MRGLFMLALAPFAFAFRSMRSMSMSSSAAEIAKTAISDNKVGSSSSFVAIHLNWLNTVGDGIF